MSAHTTKEGIEVKPGQVWRDLEAQGRCNAERLVRVRKVVDGKAVCCVLVDGRAGKETKIAIRRMHKTSTGWALVSEAP
jgi:hypothetical protein